MGDGDISYSSKKLDIDVRYKWCFTYYGCLFLQEWARASGSWSHWKFSNPEWSQNCIFLKKVSTLYSIPLFNKWKVGYILTWLVPMGCLLLVTLTSSSFPFVSRSLSLDYRLLFPHFPSPLSALSGIYYFLPVSLSSFPLISPLEFFLSLPYTFSIVRRQSEKKFPNSFILFCISFIYIGL